ncbi:hypothetical protein R3P38DRAFT_3029417 [Favolaschia claudopus]|uniref:Uncharacterized protein n=1 Tax=Favolaschia claudopus TaxID=2862362 RepID=A0AAW0AEG5_9AGAR
MSCSERDLGACVHVVVVLWSALCLSLPFLRWSVVVFLRTIFARRIWRLHIILLVLLFSFHRSNILLFARVPLVESKT